MKIKIDTRRHGKAAAISFLMDIAKHNGAADYGTPASDAATRAAVKDYLAGYGVASTRAREGFAAIVADYIGCSHEVCSGVDVSSYRKPHDMKGPALTPRDQAAHARVWLKRGSSV